MEIISTMRSEIDGYLNSRIRITDSYSFSQNQLVKRIYNLANKIYPSGNKDSQGNYKYWYDIIGPRINDETKNIDLDTRNIRLYSEMDNDRFRVFLSNALIKEWMKATEQGISLNEDVEESTGWGNMLWKRIKGGKTRLSFLDTYIINQKARSINQTPIIERHLLTAAELRAKRNVWYTDVIDDVLENYADKLFVDKDDDLVKDSHVPYYEIFERNGEMSLFAYKEANGEVAKEEDKNEYILAKVICALKAGDNTGADTPILYIRKFKKMSDVYAEYHRGRYNGRWFREGFYEALADIQIRANEIGNEIARALEIGSKQIFTNDDRSVYSNVLTDLLRGDIINTKKLERVDMRMQGLSDYIAEWNNLMAIADRITNSMEIVSASDTPSAMPFRLGALLNENANKTYLFIREKFGLALKQMYNNWILPDLLKEFRAKDIVRLTGDRAYLDEYRKMIVDGWYAANLLFIGPHGNIEADLIKEAKLEEISTNNEEFAHLETGYWEGYKARLDIDITGESMNIMADAETLASLIALETDLVRRAFLLDRIWSKQGVDTTKMPKIDLTREQKPAGTPAAPSGALGGPAPKEI